jgi:RHS repeat-associated protein
LGGRLYYPSFVADKGSTSTLSVPGAEYKDSSVTNQFSSGGSGNANNVLIRDASGKLVNLGGRLYRPEDDGFGNRYLLTSKDGTQYAINATTGDLETVTDTNGNVLTYSDTEIKSSTGVKVTFERDNQGRIISVTDPLGAKVVYGYDAKGDLVSVTDRDGNTTGFQYNVTRSHYLDKIVDPLGREAVKTEYDELGRLKKTANNSGNGVEFVYNPLNSLETVKDALGNATTYEYDTRGNVVTEVDAVGGIIHRTYNDDNREISTTIISDRSGAAGFTTTYTYDREGNKLTETDALGNTNYYTYGAKGVLLTATDALGRTSTSVYDNNGNLISTKNAVGNTVVIKSDSQGRLLSMTDALSQSVTYSYDLKGNVNTTTDILGHSINYNYDSNGNILAQSQQVTTVSGVHTITTAATYDSQGRQLTSTDTLGNKTTYTFNSLGQQTTIKDALGRVIQMMYDADGRLIETILPDSTPNDLTDNPRIKTQYDAVGRTIAKTNAAGKTTRMVYDAVGRLIETIYPDATPNDITDNPRTKTEYYSDGLVKANIDELGYRTEYRYDALGRRIATIYADNTPNDLADNPISQTAYNAVGEVTQSIDALGRVTRYQYDDLGQLTTTKFADGTETIDEYDNLGRKIAVIDQNGNKSKYQYDALDRLIGVVNALDATTSYNYDEIGRLLSIKDAEGRTTTYEYDDLGRRIATILPLGQRSTTSYDAIGNAIFTTDFNGRTTTFSYDAQNREISKLFQDGSKVIYGYTIDGLLDITTMFGSNGQATAIYDQDYDIQGRLIKRTDIIDGVSRSIQYGYDLASNKTSVTTASSITTYTYDEQNRLDLVKLNGILQADYDYDLVNNLIQTTFGNGTRETRGYDLLNHLNLIKTSRINDNTQLSKYIYTLDKVGNRTQAQETQNGQSRTVKYQYDATYRLIQEEVIDPDHGNRVSSYVYDKVGNRLTQTVNNTTTVYSYDHNDRLLSEAVNGSITDTYTYDNNGSTLTKIEGISLTTYTWNDDKRLVRANVNGTQVEYTYNDGGIRVSSINNGVETRYLLDEGGVAQVWEEYSPTSDVKVSYDYGYNLISQTQSSRTSYYVVDGLGSTRLLIDDQGQILNSYDYDGFGKTINTSGSESNKYQFAGEQFDATLGDYYLRQRFYDTETGRFVRRDTYEGDIENSMSLHKYIYADNNSINSTDPSGLITTTEVLATLELANVLFTILDPNPLSVALLFTPLGVPSSFAKVLAKTFGGVASGAVKASIFATEAKSFANGAALLTKAEERSIPAAYRFLEQQNWKPFISDEYLKILNTVLGNGKRKVVDFISQGSAGLILLEAKPLLNKGTIDASVGIGGKFAKTNETIRTLYQNAGIAVPQIEKQIITATDLSKISKNSSNAGYWIEETGNAGEYLLHRGTSLVERNGLNVYIQLVH